MLRLAQLQDALAENPMESTIERFLATHAAPLVDNEGVTFLYRDGSAKEVHLRHEIMGLESRQEFLRVAGTSLHYLPMQVPPTARIEYRLEVRDDTGTRTFVDPLNPIRSDCPYGEKSVVTAHGYTRPGFVRERADVRRGTIETVRMLSAVFAEERVLRVYLPARYRSDRAYPLLIVHDGSDYLRYAKLATVLDNLMHDREIEDFVVALTDSPRRLTEYKVDPRQGDFLTNEILPLLQERYALRDDAASRCLMGASYGALTSLHTFSRFPRTYGKVFSQSGSFIHADVRRRTIHEVDPERLEDDEPILRFVSSFSRQARSEPAKLYLSCGRFESLIFFNRSLLDVLRREGYEHHFRESYDGHNWTCWRNGLKDGFRYLFPGDVLLYYP
ncbi:MAG: hypothetical protein CME06_13095 [Gemmatimonadetes bacterium]|nr:hypothetical protein [Gemmatimonadota bacterium]